MTKEALQAILTEYGPRVQGIGLDNGRFIYLNYKDSPKTTDVQFVTLGAAEDGTGGVDFIKIVQRIMPSMGSDLITKVSFHALDTVQHVVAVEEENRYLDMRAIN